MKRLLVSSLALCLVASTGIAAAQTYPSGSYHAQGGARYDYARVLRVDPVFDSQYGSGYATSNNQRCYDRQTYVHGDEYDNGYRNDGYYEPQRTGGTRTGATVATVVGGVIGAVVGSKVGGGSARYATSAIGSMVGGMAGRQIYEQSQRPARVGTVTVCDPVPAATAGVITLAIVR